MPNCSIDRCSLDSIENSDKCILHCEKSDYAEDFRKGNFLSSFNDALIEYVLEKFFEHEAETAFPTKTQLRVFLNGTDRDRYRIEEIIAFLKNKTIVFVDIKFPARDSRDLFDYKKVLQKLGSIHFDNCHFYLSELDLDKTEVFFQDCIFLKRWYLYNHKLLENSRNVIYQMCHFIDDVSTVSDDYEKPEIDNPMFSDCVFKKELILEAIKINSTIFKNTEYKTLTLKKVTINNAVFEDKFILNNYAIDEFNCYNTEFNGKLEFKNNKVQSFIIDNSNFHKLVDCYKTEFKKCKIHKSIFDDFVGFEDCLFGDNSNTNSNNAEFIYATFMSFVNFRNSSFPDGLDLRRINHKESLNFLSVSVSLQGSNRETFRIIKNSFDKVGNYIEANEFYTKEMETYKKELIVNKKYSSLFLVNLYKLTSYYGQSYLRPIIAIIILTFIYWGLTVGHEYNTIYSLLPNMKEFLNSIANGFNGFAKSIMPFTKVLREGMEFISLIFYIIFTSLIWLVILAIKRSTKR